MPTRAFTSKVFDSDPIRPAQPPRPFGLMDIAGVGVTNVLSYQIARAAGREGSSRSSCRTINPTRSRVHLVHPGQAILPLKLRRFMEFAASRMRKSLPADLAKLSAPKTSAEKKK
jgi:hypothetical protein